MGLAACGAHPLWPDTFLVDVYCHPNHWERAPGLLAALAMPEADRYVAYGDPECPAKHKVLKAAGWRRSGVLRERVSADRAKTGFVDVIVFEKPSASRKARPPKCCAR